MVSLQRFLPSPDTLAAIALALLLAAAAQMFVQPAAGDFHLVGGAAPIDKGSDVGVASDIEGVVRPQGGGFDYGAYEYAAP